MLLAQAFSSFLHKWASNDLADSTELESLIRERAPRVLLGIYAGINVSQEKDGSWESQHEITAYGILAMSRLLSLPWSDSIRVSGIKCIERAQKYLTAHRHLWSKGHYIWIDKVAYSSGHLSEAYCLAAAKASVHISVPRNG